METRNYRKQKTATELTVTVYEKSNRSLLKRRDTTARFRLDRRGVMDLSGANVNYFFDIQKINELFFDLKTQIFDDNLFVYRVGECFSDESKRENRAKGHVFSSKYQEVKFENEDFVLVIRISDHNTNCDNIKAHHPTSKIGYGATLKSRRTPNTFKSNEDVRFVEYVYSSEKNDNKRYEKILKSILSVFEKGVYTDFAKADFVNISPEKSVLGDIPDGFVSSVAAHLAAGGDLSRNFEKKAREFWNADSRLKDIPFRQNRAYQLAETAVVLHARRLVESGKTPRGVFRSLVELYDRQPVIRPTDTNSLMLQQYSTPCPLAYLLSAYVNAGGGDRKILEPSAGNGMLTIAGRAENHVVNELDSIRCENLKLFPYAGIFNLDASDFENLRRISRESGISFDGIITNPPFERLKQPWEYDNYEFTDLDHKMAVQALRLMKSTGRAAIIVGGKLMNKYFRPVSETSPKLTIYGKWRVFLSCLSSQYNIVDVIYIDGQIYRKQGTTYPIAVILIDGRLKKNNLRFPRYLFEPERDTPLKTFDEIFLRLAPHVMPMPDDYHIDRRFGDYFTFNLDKSEYEKIFVTDGGNADRARRKRKMLLRARAMKMKTNK